MVGNELQLLVNDREEVRINATGMTVDGRVAGVGAEHDNEFVTQYQMNNAISAVDGTCVGPFLSIKFTSD